MDKEVPLLMGISKAILENVIFVHQDDANWPLAEGAVLKKKFDDIFSATRYTKALEVIKKLHKEQAVSVKEYKLKLEHLQTIHDSARKLEKNIEIDQEKSGQLQAQICALELKIAEAQNKIAEVEDSLKGVQRLQEDIRVMEGRREILVRQKTQQYNDLEVENEDTDEELAEWHSKFEGTVGLLKIKIVKTEREVNDLKTQIAAEKDNYNKQCTIKGRLQAEAEAHAKDKKDRDYCLQALFQKHSLGDVGQLPLSNEAAGRNSKRAASRLEELQQNVTHLQAANRAEHQKLTAVREKAQGKLVEASGHIKLLVKQKKDAEQSIQQLESTIQSLAVSESDVRRVEEKESSTKEEVDRISTKIKECQFDESIDEAKADIFTLGQKIKQLQREKDGLAAESGERVSLRMKKEALVDKEAALKRLLADIKERMKKALGGVMPDEKDAYKEIEKIVSSNSKALSELDSKANVAGQEAAALSMRAKDARNDLACKKRERDTKRRVLADRLFATLQDHVEADDLEEQLAVATKEAESKKRDHDLLDGMRRCFSRFMEMAEATHECPVCEREFSSPQEVDSFLKKQRTNQSQSAERLRAASSQHLEMEAKARALDQLRPVFLEYQKLDRDAIPAAERAVEETTAALQKVSEQHDDLVGMLAQMSAAHQDVKRLEGPAKEMERVWWEAEALRKGVAEAEYKLDVMSQGLRTMADVNTELAAFEEKREECTRRKEKLQEEQQNLKDDFTAWNMRWRNAREETMLMAQRLTKLKETRASLKRSEEQQREVDIDVQVWEQKLEPLRREVERLEKEQEEQNRKAEAEEAQRHGEIRVLERDVDQLRTLNFKIEHYAQTGKEAELAKVLEKTVRSQNNQEVYEKQMAELSAMLSKDQNLLENQASVKRNIDDNIAYRKTLKEEQALAAEMQALQERLLDTGNLLQLENGLKSLLREVQQWAAEKNRCQGTLSAYEGNIASNKSSLKASQYRDIDSRHRNQLFQLKTTEMANKDLDKYYNALDRALMRFHSMKMEEINKIIKELWQQTYRGQDIDYIEIRSDAEGAGTRSYSYRVVMRSGDAELDMRGRCSAGQKVLASLIIRLALAETFCLNCGILALDEPTTNLDTPNADSLAGALSRIMEDRRGQENFQLIVITHDEHFAQMIGQKQYAEKYYRISKNDHQHSRIEVQDIFE